MFVKGCFLEARSLVVTDGLVVATDSIKDVELKPCNVALHLPVSADWKKSLLATAQLPFHNMDFRGFSWIFVDFH